MHHYRGRPGQGRGRADFLYTDVWVSMDEAAAVRNQRIDRLLPYPVNAALRRASGKARTRFMHCLPAFHNLETEVGRQVHEKHGLRKSRVPAGGTPDRSARRGADAWQRPAAGPAGAAVCRLLSRRQLYPLDILDAVSEGMLGYPLEQERANLLPALRAVASLLTRVELDPEDPAFQTPAKPIGPVYTRLQTDDLARRRQWAMAPDGAGWWRVVASPRPVRVPGLGVTRSLLGRGVWVIAAGRDRCTGRHRSRARGSAWHSDHPRIGLNRAAPADCRRRPQSSNAAR